MAGEVPPVATRAPGPVVQSAVDIPAAAPVVAAPVSPADSVVAGPAPGQGYDADVTQRRIDELRARGATIDDPTTAPSFWQTALEIFDFVLRCIPGIGQIVNLFSAIVNIGYLAFKLLSGQDSERIDWTKELARIAGDLAGVAFPLAGALSNAILNYWFDTASDRRQGARVFGAEFLLGPNMQSSTGYYSRKLFEGVRGAISGSTPAPEPAVYTGPAPGQVYQPAAVSGQVVAPDSVQAAITAGQVRTLPDGRYQLPDGQVLDRQQLEELALRRGPQPQAERGPARAPARVFSPRV